MDNRLARRDGSRILRLRKEDLPPVAVGILANLRGQARIARSVSRGLPVVRVTGLGLDLTILSEDWDRLLPYIRDNVFNPLMYPAGTPKVQEPQVVYSASVVDMNDLVLYHRILSTLETVFTEVFPGDEA